MKKILCVLTFLSFSFGYAKSVNLDFKLKTAKTQENLTLKAKLGESSVVTVNNTKISVEAEEQTINNKKGIVMSLKVYEFGKLSTAQTLFMKANTSAEFSVNTFSNAPKGFSLTVKNQL